MHRGHCYILCRYYVSATSKAYVHVINIHDNRTAAEDSHICQDLFLAFLCFMPSDMTNDDEDSDCGEDGEIWEEERGYLVISADKVILQFWGVF